MLKKLIRTTSKQKLVTGAMAVALIGTPLGIQVYAQNNTETPTEEQQTTTQTEETVIPEVILTTETTEVTETETTPITPETPEVTEEEEAPTEEAPIEADLQTAINIAALEHPDVEVVAAKLKYLGDQKVYKVSFADGWRIYVSAATGEIIKIKDGSNKQHASRDCAKKEWFKRGHKTWKPYGREYRSSRQRNDNIPATATTTAVQQRSASSEQSSERQRSNSSRRSNRRESRQETPRQNRQNRSRR